MPKINPFKPQSPISPGMFTGREPEIIRLNGHLFQTKNSQPSNFLISGERGIGKSSLMLYVKYIAEGLLSTVDDQNLNFLVVDVDIDQSTTQLTLIRKIELGLIKKLEQTEQARKFFSDAWGFLQRLEVAGLKINSKNELPLDDILFDEFTYAFVETAERITSQTDASTFDATYDGILILIDEADRASNNLQLGSFLKLFTERMQRKNCDKVMIGLAGLPTLRTVLLSSHESSLRIFDELHLDRLSNDETNEVIDTCLERANQDNPVPTTILPTARDLLIQFSEGYPHFIQQFGYSAFNTDVNNEIGTFDVINGAVGENGALELIGNRYYRDSFYNKIQKESYRQILRIMAEKSNDWITKQEIREKFKGSNTVLTNAIKALRERNIILAKEGEKGIYRLQHRGFALWIALKTKNTTELQKTVDAE